jgi:penicillin-insensitive murein endopeptidase
LKGIHDQQASRRRGGAVAAGAAPPVLALVALCASCSHSPSPLTPNLLGTVGSPAHGTLTAAAELPTAGTGFRWYNPMGHHYGVPRLVNAVERAAAEVARERPGGAPLFVGDLSKRLGGQITGHRSHRTGRDVDLLFYVETPSGEPVKSPGFVKFGSDGLAFIPQERGGYYVRLDVPREWALIRTLLLLPEANVQWLFISAPLEAILTEYARARGEDSELIWHAESVMLQPADSLPHDDHLHLRTACTPEEAIVGCEGGGPYWPWLSPLPMAAPEDTDDSLVLALLSPMAPRTGRPAPLVRLPPSDETRRGLISRDLDESPSEGPASASVRGD